MKKQNKEIEKVSEERSFIITVETGFLKEPIVRITDGINDVTFGKVGGFEIETNIKFPQPVIKKFY